MALGRLISIAVISGIFGKTDEELDILPPPPPFPDIGKESGEAKEARRIIDQKEKQKQKEAELKEKEQEKKRAELEKKRQKELEEKRKSAEKERKEKLRKKGKKAAGKRVFEFFHDLNLVKTEKEKKEYRRQKQKQRKQKELEEKRKKEEQKKRDEERKKQKLEAERQRELERKKIIEERRKRKEGERKAEIEKKRKKELEDLEKIAPKPVKEKGMKAKPKIPELISLKAVKRKEEIAKPEEAVEAKEEIQKAIGGMKKAKRVPVMKELFKKKEPVKEKIETPEVMPRTYDKIDHVMLIEEKIHKARLALMDFKFDDAKKVYIEIMKMYNELEPKKKSKVYEDIKDLYYERKSAEKIAK
jgi:hypothetical protein